ncbi:MAG: M20/M25/M40 family metallo-hydrolase [Anaerolineae bacterium]|nr:M20/M25/M40 family metallo-hydrolase [Anaerolineae bacterium]NUQ07344.1 M20/M25/M40 family metallo-hydrolase [Anaerolineae bacterium]
MPIVFALLIVSAGTFSASMQEVSIEVANSAPPAHFRVLSSTLLPLLEQVDAERLMSHIESLQSFRTRHVHSPKHMADQGIGAACRYLMDEFAAMPGMRVTTQEFQTQWMGTTSTLQNVIAISPGTDEDAAVILVGAHYDSISLDATDGFAAAPGAVDNGSGVAALLELARLLHSTPHRSTLLFVGFSAEEVGLVGSRRFVEQYLPSEGLHPGRLRAVINLDIIGSSSDERGRINDAAIRVFSAPDDPSQSRHLARMTQAYAAYYGADLQIELQETLDRLNRFGDHQSFSNAGYPAVRFTSALENRYHQHTPLDLIADVNPEYLRRATRTLLTVVHALAVGLPAPERVAILSRTDSGYELTWEPVSGADGYVLAIRHEGSLVFDEVRAVGTTRVLWHEDAGVVTSFAVAARDANGDLGYFAGEQSALAAGEWHA